MLTTLVKLGKELSEGRSKWEDIILVPNVPLQNKKGDPITNYVIEIIFDIDNQEVIISKENLHLYDPERSPFELMLLKTQSRRGKKNFVTVEAKKTDAFKQTFDGDFIDEVNNKTPNLVSSDFFEALTLIKELINSQEAMTEKINNTKKGDKISKDYINKQLALNNNEKLILCYASIKCSKLKIDNVCKLIELEGYSNYIEQKLFTPNIDESNDKEKLCYISNESSKQSRQPTFSERFNINYMYQSTTKNYANDFKDKNYYRNYQIDLNVEKYLDRASEYLLKNHQIQIAGISHVIIPQFLSSTEIEFKHALKKIERNAELLFKSREMLGFTESIEDETDDLFWMTFATYESDGNYFKIINQIKDVSNLHFITTIKAFRLINKEYEEYINSKFTFNLNSIYHLIPERKSDKAKRNKSLVLFKQILEKRTIDVQQIFEYFTEYILCHRFERYNGYPNIYKNSNFDFAIKNGVSQFSALIEVLIKLNLLTNHHNMKNDKSNEKTNWLKSEEDFIKKMSYTEAQKALFYLGRALNSIAYAQSEKGHKSKPVLGKINYNGLDKNSIVRLRKDLAEKSKQYNIDGLTAKPFSKFTEFFDFNAWNMHPEEAVFFLLAGYSFWPKKEDDNSTTENN